MKVVHVHAIHRRPQPDRVGRAVDRSALDSAAGHPVAEAMRVVIASLAALGHGHPSEFAAPDDERAFEKSAALEVFEKSGDRLIGAAAHGGVICFDVVVGIPAVDVP